MSTVASDGSHPDRIGRTRHPRLAAFLLGVAGTSAAAFVFYVILAADRVASDGGSDLPAEPVRFVYGLLAAAAVLIGVSAAIGSVVCARSGESRLLLLLAVATVSGTTSGFLLVPPVAYVVVALANDLDDPAFWDLGWFALVNTGLGVAGAAAAVGMWWVVGVSGPRR